jgi:hypothetical protein
MSSAHLWTYSTRDISKEVQQQQQQLTMIRTLQILLNWRQEDPKKMILIET